MIWKTHEYDFECHFQELQAHLQILMFPIRKDNFVILSSKASFPLKSYNLHNFWHRLSFDPIKDQMEAMNET